MSILAPATVAAQSKSPISARVAYENVADRYGNWLVQAFDSIPATRYDFRPTPAQQSIGYIAQHLEGANYGLCGTFGTMKHPMTAKDSLPNDVKAGWPKDTLVRRLRASLRFCDSALAQMQSFDSFINVTFLIGFATDLAEHYSQIASYMRLLGMVPPSGLPPAPRTAISLPATALTAFVGVYELTPGLDLDVKAGDGVLDVTSTVGPLRRFYPSGANDFFAKDIDAQLTFVRDAPGTVTGLVLHFQGRNRPGRRVR